MKKIIFGFVATMLLAVTIAFAGDKKTATTAVATGCCCVKQHCICVPSPDGKSCACTGCPSMPNCVCPTHSCAKLNTEEPGAKTVTLKSCPNTPDCVCR